jgi:phosphoesterase RecJ-like protein
MIDFPESDKISEIVNNASSIVILQADNPDGDSLGSALALEEIFGDMGKHPLLYCGSEIPSYLHYLEGWDRVSKELPDNFDLSVIVDTSTLSLFGKLAQNNKVGWLATKPSIIFDHHDVDNSINFANVVCNKPAVATGEVIFDLATKLNCPLNISAKSKLAVSIMSDSLGLTVAATTANAFHIIGNMVADGVNIAELEQRRRDQMRKSPELVYYKGQLLERVEYFYDDRIATITIPWDEIQKYSPLYNPPMLVLDDMRQTTNTALAIGFKVYGDGHITAKIRCNYGYGIASKLADHFGGGGHDYASGFKITDGRNIDEVKSETIKIASELLSQLD